MIQIEKYNTKINYDIESMEDLFNESFKDYETIFKLDKNEFKWEKKIREKDNIYFILKNDADIIGMIQLLERKAKLQNNNLKIGLIAKVCILPEYRGLKYFSEMLCEVEKYALSNNYDELITYVNQNQIIKDMFISKGFDLLLARNGMVRVLNPETMVKALGRNDLYDILSQMAVIGDCKDLSDYYNIKDYSIEDEKAILEIMKELDFDYCADIKEESNWRFGQEENITIITKVLTYKENVVGIVRASIKDFFFKVNHERITVKTLILDDILILMKHEENFKILLNTLFSDAQKSGAENVVVFFPVNNEMQRLLENMKFIKEINTLLLGKSMSQNGKIAFSNKIRSFYDYYL